MSHYKIAKNKKTGEKHTWTSLNNTIKQMYPELSIIYKMDSKFGDSLTCLSSDGTFSLQICLNKTWWRGKTGTYKNKEYENVSKNSFIFEFNDLTNDKSIEIIKKLSLILI